MAVSPCCSSWRRESTWLSGFGNGFITGATFGEHVCRPDHAVPTQSAFNHDLDVVGIGERVGHQAMVGDGIRLHSIGHLKIDPTGAGVPVHGARYHLGTDLEPHVLYKR